MGTVHLILNSYLFIKLQNDHLLLEIKMKERRKEEQTTAWKFLIKYPNHLAK